MVLPGGRIDRILHCFQADFWGTNAEIGGIDGVRSYDDTSASNRRFRSNRLEDIAEYGRAADDKRFALPPAVVEGT